MGKKLGNVLAIEPGEADRLLGFDNPGSAGASATVGEEVEDVDDLAARR